MEGLVIRPDGIAPFQYFVEGASNNQNLSAGELLILMRKSRPKRDVRAVFELLFTMIPMLYFGTISATQLLTQYFAIAQQN